MMDGGLAIFGFGLFMLSIANLFARVSHWLAFATLALAVLSMGMAFSESRRLREISLGLSVALLVLAVVALATGTAWWLTLGIFLFAVAFAVLWAEYRFAYFEHVGPGDVPHHARRFHMPWHRRRAVP
jgi:hypothetical protein